jgi:hypothetical protein
MVQTAADFSKIRCLRRWFGRTYPQLAARRMLTVYSAKLCGSSLHLLSEHDRAKKIVGDYLFRPRLRRNVIRLGDQVLLKPVLVHSQPAKQVV